MPRKKPFSVKQKKKQLQDKRERKRGQCGSERRGRGSGSRTSERRGVPVAPLGGVGRGGSRAPTRAGDSGGDSVTPAPLLGRGGEGWRVGGGESLQLQRAPSPQISGGGMTIPTDIQEGPELGCCEDRASEEVGWGEGGKPGRPEKGVFAPSEAASTGITGSAPQGFKMGCDPAPTAAAGAGSGGRSRPTLQTGSL